MRHARSTRTVLDRPRRRHHRGAPGREEHLVTPASRRPGVRLGRSRPRSSGERAADYGSAGRAFDSSRGHLVQLLVRCGVSSRVAWRTTAAPARPRPAMSSTTPGMRIADRAGTVAVSTVAVALTMAWALAAASALAWALSPEPGGATCWSTSRSAAPTVAETSGGGIARGVAGAGVRCVGAPGEPGRAAVGGGGTGGGVAAGGRAAGGGVADGGTTAPVGGSAGIGSASGLGVGLDGAAGRLGSSTGTVGTSMGSTGAPGMTITAATSAVSRVTPRSLPGGCRQVKLPSR